MNLHGIRLVVFDMDGVLTTHPSSWEYVHRAMGVDNSENLRLYRTGNISYMDFLRSDVNLWISRHPGITREDVVKILDSIPLRKNLSLAVKEIRDSGAATAIVSGGIYWLAQRIADQAAFDQIYANMILTDNTGRIIPDGNVMVEPRHKDDVITAIQKRLGISEAETASVGDTTQDAAMFRHSAVSIAFNSIDGRLSGMASHSAHGNDLLEITRILAGER